MYSCFRIINQTHSKPLAELLYRACVLFLCFQSHRLHFQDYLDGYLFYIWWFHIYLLQLDSLIIFYFPSWVFHILNPFLKKLCTLKSTLCDVKVFGFGKYIMIFIITAFYNCKSYNSFIITVSFSSFTILHTPLHFTNLIRKPQMHMHTHTFSLLLFHPP